MEARSFHPCFLSSNVLSLLFELKSFIFAFWAKDFILVLLMKVLKGYIFALLLNSHMQVERLKISSLLFELESFILALSIDMLKGFILAFFLEAMVWLLYNWCLAAPRAAGPGIVRIWKKLHCLAGLAHLKVSAPVSKAKECKYWSRNSKIRRSKRYKLGGFKPARSRPGVEDKLMRKSHSSFDSF